MTRTIFFAENLTAAGTVDGEPVTKRAEFLALLDGVGSEGFESFATNTDSPFSLTFPGSDGDITATLQAAGGPASDARIRIWDGEPETFLGRFNTTPAGSKFLQASGDFEVTFSTPIAAFGFYGTDIGDFDASLEIVLTDSDGNAETITFPASIPSPDGALTFWGFIDDAKTYNKVRFNIAQSGDTFDVFGFDDMVIGDPAQAGVQPPAVAPELRVSRGWGATYNVVTIAMVEAPAAPAPPPPA